MFWPSDENRHRRETVNIQRKVFQTPEQLLRKYKNWTTCAACVCADRRDRQQIRVRVSMRWRIMLIQTAWKVVSRGRAERRILVSHAPSSGLVSNRTSKNDTPSAAAAAGVPTVSPPCDEASVGGCVDSGSGKPSTDTDCRLACTLYTHSQ